MRINGYYNDGEYEVEDDMSTVASHCSRFTRRGDLTAFNMMDYQSCENCRHMTADNRCLMRLDNRISGDK